MSKQANSAKVFANASSELFTHAVVSRKPGQRPVKGFAFDAAEASEMARQLREIGWKVEIFTR